MTARFVQFPLNQRKLTNELGYILQDRALSVLQAQEVVECADCLCPSKSVSCLRVPCNLLSRNCSNMTLPLFDASTRAPFKIKRGSLIESIILIKRRGACLDDCLSFVLGTICGNDCDSECDPQRWVTESCPVSGAQLNKCGIVKVDATQKHKLDCPLFLCRSGQCAGQCGPSFAAQSKPCDGEGGQGYGKNCCDDSISTSCSKDSHGCPCVVEQDGCCTFCGKCDFAGGELQDCMIGITLLNGDLGAEDVLIAVESWEQCCFDSCEEDEDVCAGVPQFAFGAHGGY